jgi:LPXTG-motif cell wall-anchored protein
MFVGPKVGRMFIGAAVLAGSLAVTVSQQVQAWTAGEPTIALVSGGDANISASARDVSGNLVVVGYNSSSPADFDPSSNVVSIAANRGFVAKYSPTGDLLWAGELGGALPRDVAIDSDGDIFVVGLMTGAADLDPGDGTVTLTPNNWDGFIVRLNSDGEYELASTYGGSNNEWFNSVAISGTNLHVVGQLSNSGANNTLITNCGPTNNACSFFLSTGGLLGHVSATSLDASWVVSMGAANAGATANLEVEVDSNYVYVLGEAGILTDLDPGAGTVNFTPTGSKDAYWVVLNHDGTYVRSGGMFTAGAGTKFSQPTGVGIDTDGNLYITSSVRGENVTIGGMQYSISNATTSVIVRVSSTGTVSGVTVFTDREPQAIKVVGSDLYVTGLFFTVSPSGYAYVEKLTSSGSTVWRSRFPGLKGATLVGVDLAVESDGSVLATGQITQGAVTLDTCAGTTVTNAFASAWVLKTDQFGAAEEVPTLSWPSSSIEIADGVANSFTLPISCDRGTVWSVTDGALPAGLSLDVGTGVISGTPTTSGTYEFTVSATNSKGSITQKFAGTMVPPRAPSWPASGAEESLGSFARGVQNSVFVTSGGLPAPTYAITSGSLPSQMQLDATTGEITGTPPFFPMTYSFTITATNVVGSASQAFSGQIVAPASPTWSGSAPELSLTVGTQFTATYSASGPPAPRYTISSGSLPEGLSLNTRTGTISGTPKTPGDIAFTISATNSSGTSTRDFSGKVLSSSGTGSSESTSGESSSGTTSGTTATTVTPTSGVSGTGSPSRAEALSLPVARLVAAGEVVAGGRYTLVADGFTAGENVNAYLVGSSTSLGVSKASSSGSARVAIRIPTSASGKKTLVLFGATSRKGVRQSITVTGSPETLPATGGSMTTLVWLMILLVSAGVVTRRRFRV